MTATRIDRVTVADGTFDLHIWIPESGSGPGILLIQEIFGVGEYITGVAEKLAAAGYVVGAPDVFWRFAPGWSPGQTPEALQASMEQVAKLDFPKAIEDCVAAYEQLTYMDETGGRAGVLGFCLGGTLAWGVAGAADPDCVVSYYGSGVPSMIDLVETVTAPTLFHFGSEDPFLPFAGVEALNAAIEGHPNVQINVEIAGHAFDNFASEMFYNESAANAAWPKTMAFLDTNLKS